MSLVNTSAVKQDEGLKHTDDRHDARWLAHLMRLGILPTGYIYPKQHRPVRDLLCHRIRLVEQRTANRLSVQNVLARETGQMIKGNDLRALSAGAVRGRLSSSELCLALDSRLRLIALLDEEIDRLEEAALERGKLRLEYRVLLSVPGIGKTLGLVIMYETGDIGRFPGVGHYASYCRCVRWRRSRRFRGARKPPFSCGLPRSHFANSGGARRMAEPRRRGAHQRSPTCRILHHLRRRQAWALRRDKGTNLLTSDQRATTGAPA